MNNTFKISLKSFLVLITIIAGTIKPEPFSFEFPEEVNNTILQEPSYITASDAIKLAHYAFVPENPQALLIFYHGGGAWSTKLYQHMAQQLKDNHQIGTYLFDIRGHGNSHGPVGDAPSTEQIWKDVSSAIDFVQQQHPDTAIFLGGHSSGAGLVLNYSDWCKNPAVKGYVFLSPFLGHRSETAYEHEDPEKRFIKKVCLWKIILNAITGGWLFTHSPVIFFNYPDQEKKKDNHLLEYYTNAMSNAVTPYDAKPLFTKLDKPFVLLVGEKDEQFNPTKIIVFAEHAALVQNDSVARVIPDATHLSIVTDAIDVIAQEINTMKNTKSLVLGDHSQHKAWIYLCGLTQNFNSEQEIKNRKLLDIIGLATKTKFIAIQPTNRCSEFDNKLCWPHDDDTALQNTYQYILKASNGHGIAGFIGFSNGGFFLNKLVQKQQLNVPIISIGSAGFVASAPYENDIYLIIGKQDEYHYEHALNFAKSAKKYPHLRTKVIEHEGGHEIPVEPLISLLKKITHR